MERTICPGEYTEDLLKCILGNVGREKLGWVWASIQFYCSSLESFHDDVIKFSYFIQRVDSREIAGNIYIYILISEKHSSNYRDLIHIVQRETVVESDKTSRVKVGSLEIK